ncbi:MAG: ABC transporter permease [bacterium]|nr:ABC transporter permease [bacterium]
MNKILLIAKREYLKIVRSKSFWAIVLLLPIFYIVIGTLVSATAQSVEKKIEEEAKEAKRIVLVDSAGVLRDSLFTESLERIDDADRARQLVVSGEVDAAIVYPPTLASDQGIAVYAQDTGLLSRDRFSELARTLLKQSILQNIESQEQRELFNSEIAVSTTIYDEGEEVQQGIEVFLIPIVSVVLYFLLVILSASFMLASVSEEKENRMIETMLSIVPARQLVWGKILGLTGVAITQLLTLIAFGIVAYNTTTNLIEFQINWAEVPIGFWQIILAVFYIFTGFLFISSVMVGVGSAMPNHREAQSFSSLFIILSIFPIYLATPLIADPNGPVAVITSYFPFTSALVLLFRTSIGAIAGWESALGIAAMLVYVAVGLWAAHRLFALGAMEVSKKLSFNFLLKHFRSK